MQQRKLPRAIQVLVSPICQRHGVTWESIVTKGLGNQIRERTRCRAEIAHALKRRGLSLAHIGRYLNLDHSSVNYILKRYDERFGVRDPGNPFNLTVPDLSGEWAI